MDKPEIKKASYSITRNNIFLTKATKVSSKAAFFMLFLSKIGLRLNTTDLQ